MIKPVVLFIPMDMLSHHLRCLQLADALRDSATCIFLTAHYKELIESRNPRAVFCESVSAEDMIQRCQRGDMSWMSGPRFEPVFLKQLDCIAAIRPDYIVNDYSFTGNLAAEKSGVLSLSLVNGLFSRYYCLPRGGSRVASRSRPRQIHSAYRPQSGTAMGRAYHFLEQ